MAANGALMLLDAISEIELFVHVFIGVYTIALIAYILMTWVRMPYSLQPVQRFFYDVCDPYLRLWRRILPFGGSIDFSPIVALLALGVFTYIIDAILNRL